MMPWLPRRWPLVPTLLVALAVAAMAVLGAWQLHRVGQKEALIAEVRHNPSRPAMAFPELGPLTPDTTFRRSSVNCLSVDSWTTEAGRSASKGVGFRYIAHCRTGAEGPGALVSLGIGNRPDLKPTWNGGIISGWIASEPDHRPVIARIFGPKMVMRPMLVVEKSPDAQLRAPALPDADDIPNNHLAYAVQWFLFAAIAALIYVLALGRRQAGKPGDDS
jgi:surfeit locus 1 family protein